MKIDAAVVLASFAALVTILDSCKTSDSESGQHSRKSKNAKKGHNQDSRGWQTGDSDRARSPLIPPEGTEQDPNSDSGNDADDSDSDTTYPYGRHQKQKSKNYKKGSNRHHSSNAWHSSDSDSDSMFTPPRDKNKHSDRDSEFSSDSDSWQSTDSDQTDTPPTDIHEYSDDDQEHYSDPDPESEDNTPTVSAVSVEIDEKNDQIFFNYDVQGISRANLALAGVEIRIWDEHTNEFQPIQIYRCEYHAGVCDGDNWSELKTKLASSEGWKKWAAVIYKDTEFEEAIQAIFFPNYLEI